MQILKNILLSLGMMGAFLLSTVNAEEVVDSGSASTTGVGTGTVNPTTNNPPASAFVLGDAVRGKKLAIVCTSCHTFEKGGPEYMGPSLFGVVGRDIAAAKSFTYSPAIQKLEGTWTPERLDAFITNPMKDVPGTVMIYSVPKPKDRADIIAYLATLQ